MIIHVVEIGTQPSSPGALVMVSQLVVDHAFRLNWVHPPTFNPIFQVGPQRLSLPHGDRREEAVKVVHAKRYPRLGIEEVVGEVARQVHQVVVHPTKAVIDMAVLQIPEERKLLVQLVLRFGEKVELRLPSYIKVPLVVCRYIGRMLDPWEFPEVIAIVVAVHSTKGEFPRSIDIIKAHVGDVKVVFHHLLTDEIGARVRAVANGLWRWEE